MSDALARFQTRMSEILADSTDPETALERLRADPSSEPFRRWLDEADPRMVAVAAELVRRWTVAG